MTYAPLYYGGGGVAGDTSYIRTDINDAGPITIPTADYTQVAIVIAFERPNRAVDVAVISDADITKTTTSIRVSVPFAVRSVARQLRYSIRSGSTVLVSGFWRVRYRPGADEE